MAIAKDSVTILVATRKAYVPIEKFKSQRAAWNKEAWTLSLKLQDFLDMCSLSNDERVRLVNDLQHFTLIIYGSVAGNICVFKYRIYNSICQGSMRFSIDEAYVKGSKVSKVEEPNVEVWIHHCDPLR